MAGYFPESAEARKQALKKKKKKAKKVLAATCTCETITQLDSPDTYILF